MSEWAANILALFFIVLSGVLAVQRDRIQQRRDELAWEVIDLRIEVRRLKGLLPAAPQEARDG